MTKHVNIAAALAGVTTAGTIPLVIAAVGQDCFDSITALARSQDPALSYHDFAAGIQIMTDVQDAKQIHAWFTYVTSGSTEFTKTETFDPNNFPDRDESQPDISSLLALLTSLDGADDGTRSVDELVDA